MVNKQNPSDWQMDLGLFNEMHSKLWVLKALFGTMLELEMPDKACAVAVCQEVLINEIDEMVDKAQKIRRADSSGFQ